MIPFFVHHVQCHFCMLSKGRIYQHPQTFPRTSFWIFYSSASVVPRSIFKSRICKKILDQAEKGTLGQYRYTTSKHFNERVVNHGGSPTVLKYRAHVCNSMPKKTVWHCQLSNKLLCISPSQGKSKVQLSDPTPFYKNYTKPYFDANTKNKLE